MDLDLEAALSFIREGKHLDEKSSTMILYKFIEVLYEEPNVLELLSPITVCGDIHGQLFDLFELFRISGEIPSTQFLFLGDYVDRGYYSLETFLYLALLKLKHPEYIHLLRGNHESRQVSKTYGFYDECLQNYGHPGIWNLCQEAFDLLPMAAMINNKIFCVHGGLSPEISCVEQISLMDRQQEIPTFGAVADLYWSDPDDINGWGVTTRGSGWLFGKTPSRVFCQNNNLEFITRAHQLVQTGYDIKFEDKVITVWSAPNYTYVTGNVASVMRVDRYLNKEFRIFNDVPNISNQKPPDHIPHYFA